MRAKLDENLPVEAAGFLRQRAASITSKSSIFSSE
jgi:hypothetical protein